MINISLEFPWGQVYVYINVCMFYNFSILEAVSAMPPLSDMVMRGVTEGWS